MSDPRSGELSPSEREALASLRRHPAPPAALEDKVVGSLRERGWFRAAATVPRSGWRRWALALAAAAGCFLAGLLVGRRQAAAPAPAGGGPRFLLLLREDPRYQNAPPGREQERVEEYRGWAERLGGGGVLLAGEKLEDGGRILEPEASGAAVVLPLSAARGAVAGYFVVRASDETAASAVARTCPHLRYRGTVEIRRISELP